MIQEQQPSEKVLGLQDALSLGIEDVLKKDCPEKLDLFFVGDDKMLHIAPNLARKLETTLGIVWSTPPSEEYDEESRNWAINRFLALNAPFDLLAKEDGEDTSPFTPYEGYIFQTEKRQDKPDEDPKLWISAVSKEKPYLTGEKIPSLLTPLMKVVINWAASDDSDELRLFMVENFYISDQAVKANVVLSTEVLERLIAHGISFKDLRLYEQVLEFGVNRFLSDITHSSFNLRALGSDPKIHNYPTTLEGLTLRIAPLKANPGFIEFSLVKKQN